MPRHLMFLSALLVCAGCGADSAIAPSSRYDTANEPYSDTGSQATDTTGDSAAQDAEPVWFTLGATLTVADGLATEVEVVLGFLDEALDPLTCTESRAVDGVVGWTETPDPSVFHWWALALGAPEVACAAADQLPSQVFLGLGRLHPEVEAQLLARGLDEVASSLYGAYALVDESQLELDADQQVAWAFGYAGTESDLRGETTAAAEAPVPDGTYTVQGLYAFPLIQAVE